MIRDAYKRLYRDVEPGRALIERTARRAVAQGKRARGRTVLIPVVAALLALLGFAYAATQSGLLKWVFGPFEPMPEAQELVESVGARAEGQFVSASVEEVFFDGAAGYVQWNLTTDSREPLVVLRSMLWSEEQLVYDDYDPQRSSVFKEVRTGAYRHGAELQKLGPNLSLAALMGGEYPGLYKGASSFGLIESWNGPELKLLALDEPSELSMTFLVVRPTVPLIGDFPWNESLPPRAIQRTLYDNAGRFLYDIERVTITRTGDDPPGWEPLKPGETETYETIERKDLEDESMMAEESDTLLTSLGLLEEREAMLRNPNRTEVLRWFGNLLEIMDFGEIVEEVTVSFTLKPRSELPVNTGIVGQSAFEFDAFRTEILSADFNAMGGDIRMKLWPDYEKADPRIRWRHTDFDVFAYRDGEQIGDQPAYFSSPLVGNLPEPWFEEPPPKSEVFEGILRIAPVPIYPDTLVIVPKFRNDSHEALRDMRGKYSMTIHVRETNP
ncbi:MAG: hypothetical protein GX592_02945 [Clostridiales bacterium]|nr:hypothetical protein [Clostridiales bacterium]